MAAVTACIITLDEEPNIGPCLDSVAFCDARIVVDSGSRDRTCEIAREKGARVIARGWPGHVEQKNFAIDQAETDWVLCIDADERVTSELAAEIRRVLASPEADGYSMPRWNYYLGRRLRIWGEDRKLRLFRRSAGRWGGQNPHDRVEMATRPVTLQGAIVHHPYRDFAAHLRTIDSFTSTIAREKLKEGVRAPGFRMVLFPPFKFIKHYVLRGGFLDGWPGFVASAASAWYEFLKYAKLWELRHLKDPDVERGRSSYADGRV